MSKKLLCVVMAIIFMVSTVVSVSVSAEENVDYGKEETVCDEAESFDYNEPVYNMLGDVDDDGYITAADARIVLRVSSRLETYDDFEFMDIDFDGQITASDARKILNVSSMLENDEIYAPVRKTLLKERTDDVKINMSCSAENCLPGDSLCVVISAENMKGLQSGNLFIEYDPDKLEFVQIEKAAPSEYSLFSGGNPEKGIVTASFIYSESAKDDSEVAVITFSVLSLGETTIECNIGTWNGTAVPYNTDLTINSFYKDYGAFTYSVTEGKVTIEVCDKTFSGEIIIPDTIEGYPVSKIGTGAFKGCTGLIRITIPDSVTTIGDSAFSGCSDIEAVVIGNSVKVIGENAFYNCDSITSVTMGDSVETIKQLAFAGCKSLKNIVISETVEYIGASAFSGTALEKIVINNPKCVIEYNADTIPVDAVIYGHVNSPAQMYAQMYGRDFVPLSAGECEHTYSEWVIDADATCTQRGFAHRVCTLCNGYEFDVIDETGHINDDADNICDVCDEVLSTQTPDTDDGGESGENNSSDGISSFFASIKELFNRIISWFRTIFGMV